MSIFLRTGAQEIVIPSALTYRREVETTQQKVHWCWSFFQTPLEKIGLILRNAFYLPYFSKKIDLEYELKQGLAERITQVLKNSEIRCSSELDNIRQVFSVKDIPIQLEGPISQIFTVRVFESKIPIEQKKLRIVLFSFNRNIEVEGDSGPRKWNPLTIRALGESPILVMNALKFVGMHIDSIVATSLGNVVENELKYLLAKEDFGNLPNTLIINRGLTSVQKVANKRYFFPINYLLYGAAKISGWDANPEKELLHFLKREKQVFPLSQRKIIFIEALKDIYFSGKGRFNLDTHEKVANLGHKVFRASFDPFDFPIRDHHALSLDHFVMNSKTEILMDTVHLDLSMNQKITSAIAKNIFLSGEGECHTCFYICGNDATLDIGTEREILPLLSAFIEEGQSAARIGALDEYKDENIKVS